MSTKKTIKYYIDTEGYIEALYVAAEKKGITTMDAISIYAGLGRCAVSQINVKGYVTARTGISLREAFDVDYRNYLIKPPVNKEEKKAPQEATKPAQTNGNDVVNLLAECLIEILAELKDRHKNIHYFTPEESLFISLCLQNKEKVKKVFTDETD